MLPGPLTSVVLMGVSGSGKTTVGRRAAVLAGVPFIDADDLHPLANVAKMSAGHPLDDADRAPWLDRVARVLADETGAVVACSALRRSYRDRLRRDAPHVVFILLQLSRMDLERRLAARPAHFMPVGLLDSQLAALEAPAPDEGVLVLDATRPIEELAAAVAVLAAPRVD